MKNLTNLYKKLDRITEKMSAIDETKTTVQQLAALNSTMARSLGILTKIAIESREEGRRSMHEIATMARAALEASRESAERTAKILSHIRKH